MSRCKQQKSSSAPPSKRRRGSEVPAFGAQTADDDASLLQPSHFPSSTASSLSTRALPPRDVPSLSYLAAHRFATHIQVLLGNARSWAYSKRYLKLLPDALVPKLFSMLRTSCPTVLSHGLIVLYFFRGPSLLLSSDLPGVTRQTVLSVINNATLRELHLIGFDKFSDAVFASILPALPYLRILVLRGCSKVSTRTAEVISNGCPSLMTLNLNYTSVPPSSLLGVLSSCTGLEVLKVAGIPNWTDGTFARLLAGLAQEPDLTLPHMKSLKFRQLGISENSVYAFIARCPNLARLDASFIRLHRLPPPTMTLSALEKLSLTSTALSSAGVISLISILPNLRTIYLGALGSGQGSSSSVGNASAMTMTDDTLASLTDILSNFDHLEKLSLVGNTKLGLASRHDEYGPLAKFIRRVGRRCKHLNLSGLPYLRSEDLCGLISGSDMVHDHGPCRLEQLALNNTGIDDGAARFIACCPSLAVLQVAGTRLTSGGLFVILGACPRLEQLDLTSCRGIKVADRRRFFEVWESKLQLENT